MRDSFDLVARDGVDHDPPRQENRVDTVAQIGEDRLGFARGGDDEDEETGRGATVEVVRHDEDAVDNSGNAVEDLVEASDRSALSADLDEIG